MPKTKFAYWVGERFGRKRIPEKLPPLNEIGQPDIRRKYVSAIGSSGYGTKPPLLANSIV
jgi:hypothetical protein